MQEGRINMGKNIKTLEDVIACMEQIEKEYKAQSKSKQEVINVFSMQLAESLCFDYGYFKDLVRIDRNKNRQDRKVYLFKYSQELQDAIDKEVSMYRKAKANRAKEAKNVDIAIKENKCHED